jgi:hypothetical protein
MASSAIALASHAVPTPAAQPAWKRLLGRIARFLEVLDGEPVTASDLRVQRLEQRLAVLERAAAATSVQEG